MTGKEAFEMATKIATERCALLIKHADISGIKGTEQAIGHLAILASAYKQLTEKEGPCSALLFL